MTQKRAERDIIDSHKTEIKAHENKFIHHGCIDFEAQQDLMDKIESSFVFGIENSAVINLHLEQLSSYLKYIEHIEATWSYDMYEGETICSLIGLILKNMSKLNDSDLSIDNISSKENSIKKILVFCDNAICDLYQKAKDSNPSEDSQPAINLYESLEHIESFIDESPFFPFQNLFDVMQSNLAAFKCTLEKCERDSYINLPNLKPFITTFKNDHQYLYLTAFTPNNDRSFFINGTEYSDYKDINKQIRSLPDDTRADYVIQGKYTKNTDGQSLEIDVEYKATAYAFQAIASNYLMKHSTSYALACCLPGVKECLNFPQTAFEEIYFHIMIKDRMSQLGVAPIIYQPSPELPLPQPNNPF